MHSCLQQYLYSSLYLYFHLGWSPHASTGPSFMPARRANALGSQSSFDFSYKIIQDTHGVHIQLEHNDMAWETGLVVSAVVRMAVVEWVMRWRKLQSCISLVLASTLTYISEGVLDVEQCPTARYTPGGPLVWRYGTARYTWYGMVWYGREVRHR